MAMNRNQKAELIEEIGGKLDQYPVIYLTNYSGLTVAQANELRNLFRDAGVDFKVYKNTFVRLAMEERGGYEGVFEHLNGPTAVALSDEPSKPARVIKKFLEGKDNTKPELKGAYIDGAIYGGDALDVLSKLKSKQEVLGDIIGLLLSPMANVVGALQSAGGNLAGAIQTIAEREEA